MTKNLTPKQLKAVEALATCADMTKAAEVAGISRDTLYRWMREETFKCAVDAAVSSAIDNLSRELVALGGKATKTLEKAMDDDKAATGARVNAANIVLSRLLELREQHSLEERLTRLEENYERQKQKD